MSRSFKKPVANTTWIRIPCCVVSHGKMKKWKQTYNRKIRHYNNYLVRQILITNNINLTDLLIYSFKKTLIADPWGGPGDGWYYNTILEYTDYIK